ncbi:MAG TPA: STM3941 family protein [Pyrinomonadaceae bacterium]|nr:STM3941 family protein [Pyrinomonadaceae bacterium]
MRVKTENLPGKYDMDSNDETIIEMSKKKIVLLLLGVCVFVAIGIRMFTLDDASIQSGRGMNNPMLVHGLGLAAIVFFGIFGLVGLKKLFDKKPALILNNSGIVDNASSVSAGFIPWSEVVGARIVEVQKQKMLVINVRDPEEYIARGNLLQQTLNKASYKMVGSPISISSNMLAINFSELISLFDQYQRKYAGANRLHSNLEPDGSSPESVSVQDGQVEGLINLAEAPETQLLNWPASAVRGTVGAGGLGILVLGLSSMDLLFHIRLPFWIAFTASLLPMFIFFVAVPDFLPRRFVRPAQWFAAVWYLVFAVLSISLAAFRGLEGIEFLLIGFVLLGAWPCVAAVRKLRVVTGA